MVSTKLKIPLISIFLCLVGFVLGRDAAVGAGRCGFPALYSFGDSNSDVGGRLISEVRAPNGESFFGRICDGRLIIDFIAGELRLPYLNTYVESNITNNRHGVSFAKGGASIRPGGYSPVNLMVQVNRFSEFKSRTTALYNRLNNIQKPRSNLPRPEDFTRAFYTLDIGQNDLAYGFQYNDERTVISFIPDILNAFSNAVQGLYREGARYFWVHNTGPIGCLPSNIFYDQQKPGNLDQFGCVDYQNRVAQEFNKQLKVKVSQLRAQLLDTAFTYVDVYSAKHDLFTTYKSLGFNDPQKFCCGIYSGNSHINCGEKATINGTVYGDPCSDPGKFISWDGVHYTQAANSLIAKRIISGSLSDPPNAISGACHMSLKL